MVHYTIEESKLTLEVKKSPLFIRSVMFLFSFLFFLFPVSGMIGYIASGNGFHIGFLIGIFLFSLMGYYLLRISLWNTFGKEEISFNGTQISYFADYGWFKDSSKIITIDPLVYSIRPIGYEGDNEGTLIIGEEASTIECVTKMPIKEIEELIKVVENR